MAAEMENMDKIDLTQPEILSKEILLHVLKTRNIDTEGLHIFDKSVIVSLFHQHVTPLPQRKYRMNRSGRERTKMQIKINKRKRTYDQTNTQSSSVEKQGTITSPSQHSSNLSMRSNCSNLNGRLKPPPSAINPERKTITLKKSPLSPDPLKSNSSSDFVINEKKKTDKQSDVTVSAHNEKTLVKINSPIVSPSSGQKIKLKRTFVSQPPPVTIIEKKIDTNNKQSETNMNSKYDDISKTESKAKAAENNTKFSEQDKESSDSDEAVLRKKFKRIDVKWP